MPIWVVLLIASIAAMATLAAAVLAMRVSQGEATQLSILERLSKMETALHEANEELREVRSSVTHDWDKRLGEITRRG